MDASRFFICPHCKNIIGLIEDGGGVLVCCGTEMEELVPNTAEAAHEKHLPVASVSGNTVNAKIGSAAHPMTGEHHISFIYLQTKHGGQRKCLKPDEAPEAVFVVSDDEKPVAVYAYCNLHGLWKTEL